MTLDPVPVHRDEKFWTLFQCTGTKILDPVPVHRDENVSDTSMMSIYHPSSGGNATLSLGFIGRQSSVWGRQSSVWGDKAQYDVMFPKSRKKLPAARENSFTHQQHVEQQDCMSIATYDKPSDVEVQEKMTNRGIEIQSTTFKNLH